MALIIKGLDSDTCDIIDRLLKNLKAKGLRNELRASYYDGKRAIRQVGTVIPPQYYRLGTVLGWSSKAVDLLARRCNLDAFVWSDGTLDDIGAREVWRDNMIQSEADQAIVSALIHGTAFVVAIKGESGEAPVLIHFKDAENATGEWNARTRRLDNLLSVTERKKGRPSAITLHMLNRTVMCEKVGSVWVLVDDSTHTWGRPFEMLPYQPHIRRPFGHSRISRPIMAIQDMATREIIRLEGHMDVYSYPELWMLGADASVFTNADGSQQPSWQIMLGRIKGLPDDEDATTPRAEVKQFPASSPEPHLKALNAYAKMMAREASLPDTALAIEEMSNPTSAESYDASQYELIAEAEGACRDWSPGLSRIFAKALAMAQDSDADGHALEVKLESLEAKWRDPRYISRAAMADAGMKQLQAMPWLAETEVGLDLLGLTEQQKQIALAEQRRARASSMLETLVTATESGQ